MSKRSVALGRLARYGDDESPNPPRRRATITTPVDAISYGSDYYNSRPSFNHNDHPWGSSINAADAYTQGSSKKSPVYSTPDSVYSDDAVDKVIGNLLGGGQNGNDESGWVAESDAEAPEWNEYMSSRVAAESESESSQEADSESESESPEWNDYMSSRAAAESESSNAESSVSDRALGSVASDMSENESDYANQWTSYATSAGASSEESESPSVWASYPSKASPVDSRDTRDILRKVLLLGKLKNATDSPELVELKHRIASLDTAYIKQELGVHGQFKEFKTFKPYFRKIMDANVTELRGIFDRSTLRECKETEERSVKSGKCIKACGDGQMRDTANNRCRTNPNFIGPKKKSGRMSSTKSAAKRKSGASKKKSAAKRKSGASKKKSGAKRKSAAKKKSATKSSKSVKPFKFIHPSEELVNHNEKISEIEFDISRFGKYIKVLKFPKPITVKTAIKKVEKFLSKPIDEVHYNIVKDDLNSWSSSWSQSFTHKSYGDLLGDAVYLDAVKVKNGAGYIVTGS